MVEMIESVKLFLTNLDTSQYVAIFVAVLAVSCAVKVVKNGISVLLSIVGLLAALYFVSPELYTQLFDYLNQIWTTFSSAML